MGPYSPSTLGHFGAVHEMFSNFCTNVPIPDELSQENDIRKISNEFSAIQGLEFQTIPEEACLRP